MEMYDVKFKHRAKKEIKGAKNKARPGMLFNQTFDAVQFYLFANIFIVRNSTQS